MLQLSKALQAVPADFLQSESGIVPTWRFYFIKTGGVLLLPNKLSNLILYSASQEDREEHLHRYMKPNLLAPFALTHQLFQLLYLSAAKVAPYEVPETRIVNWKHVPLSLGFTSLNKESAALIDKVLDFSPSEVRETFSSAYSSSENLSWFDEQLETLTWDVQEEDKDFEDAIKTNSELHEYMEKLQQKAKRKTFWRKKGFALTAILVAALIIIASVTQVIIKANQPPYTAQMDPPQIIEEFFEGQNNLDIEQMNASLSKNATNPFENAVTSLFVNSRIREAYEGIDSIIAPQEFKSITDQQIPSSTLVYGVDNLTIEQVDEKIYDAKFVYWISEVVEDMENPEKLITIVTLYLKKVRFTFTDEKGYYQISDISELEEDLIGSTPIN
jgi:hypothetical protein